MDPEIVVSLKVRYRTLKMEGGLDFVHEIVKIFKLKILLAMQLVRRVSMELPHSVLVIRWNYTGLLHQNTSVLPTGILRREPLQF